MSIGGGKLFPLQDNQVHAVEPGDSVWLSASAGTGKTQVLSSRVLRLLLTEGVSPTAILCLTFTKAGAAEMATRINARLAGWVRKGDIALAAELKAIGAPYGPADRARARTLFAAVLDCPGGGLRIDTIHAFAQWLLAAFPGEAGLAPGTRPMEDRDRVLLAREVLAAMLVDADPGTTATAQGLSLRLGPDGVQNWLMACADAADVWDGPGALQPPMLPRVRRLIGLPADMDGAGVAGLCDDNAFDCKALQSCLDTLRQWNTKSGREAAAAAEAFLDGDADARIGLLAGFSGTLVTKAGEAKNLKSLEKIDPGYGACIDRVIAAAAAVEKRRTLEGLAEWLAPALELGRAFALRWQAAKAREGLIDFDDQIRAAARLLTRSDMGDWIRYKLDRRFDHVLIDEAQDTNAAQWAIIDALTGDFFAGHGQKDGERLRTLFVVGDYKQAIFRFQGTSPENFERARDRVRRQMRQAGDNLFGLDTAEKRRPLREYGLGRSYRTAQDVLDFVDRAIHAIGPERFGLKDPPEPHVGDTGRPGLVALWPPVRAIETDDEGSEDDGWLPAPDRRMADRIAAQIRRWMDDGFPLAKGGARLAGPGDVMVLVRKRRDLAGLIVARLHAAGVPVAGVDRLRLGAPLGVRDLLAALRFAAQPLDDLSLACLLVSPLVGWSQEMLLTHGYRDQNTGLWAHLRRLEEPAAAAACERLDALLARADYEPPQALLHWLLTGPFDGRRRLVARLGREASDPIDELLNAAAAYAAAHTPSLAGFLQWFDAGDGELKREAGSGEGLVRVMTVHGSKGLQAPIVILADAAGDPDAGRRRDLALTEPDVPGAQALSAPRTVPLPPLKASEKVGRIAAADAEAAAAERAEHWRLLYVAMTRAEEALFIGGALGRREEEPKPDSWYGQLAPLFSAAEADPVWGERQVLGKLAPFPRKPPQASAKETETLPPFADIPVGPEPRPPRPLAPSAAGADASPDPPLPPGAGRDAARRGVMIHVLLERLPAIAAPGRLAAALRWLARHAPELTEDERAEMAERAMAVLAVPGWAPLFGPDALAEVPLVATVGGQVIAGTADRLWITPDRVLVVDYKTARRPPADLADIPPGSMRQMAAYVAALEVIHPQAKVDAALLYTQTPQLFALPDAVLAPLKAALRGG